MYANTLKFSVREFLQKNKSQAQGHPTRIDTGEKYLKLLSIIKAF